MKNRCQIFTPKLYVNKILNAIDYEGEKILGKYILENSCGQGNILIEVVKRYINAAKSLGYSNKNIKKDLEKYIIGYEIDEQVFNSCIENLNAEAKKHGIEDIKWNIKNKNYLKAKIDIPMNFIVGNPPYIMYRNLTIEEREYLKSTFLSCAKGKFDYCYAFIEKSLTELSNNGKMSYIVPNSIFKNVFGQELREIMKNSLQEIYDYKESVVFENVLTSPAIISFNKNYLIKSLKYHDVDNKKIYIIDKNKLKDKWLFSIDSEVKSSEEKTEKFRDYFKVSNSIATLLNSAYLIDKKKIIFEDDNFIELEDYRIEKGVLRSAASPRSFSITREEYIIFPYKYENGVLVKFEEEMFKEIYPGAWSYLSSYSEELGNRKSDKSAKWFEYGRSQALAHLKQEKILISSVLTDDIKIYRLDEDTIPYSGFYIVPIADKSLDEAERILRTTDFYSYISLRGINANGRSLRFSVKDILEYPL